MKKILALLLAITMIAAFCACAQKPADTTPADTSADTASDAPAASDGKLIKVGIINNDPNESGYRTANDKDLKAMFTEENGYDASFAYSLKNDEQIAAAQKFIQDEVDYLLISAAGTSGWDSVLQDAQAAGIQVILFDRTIDADESLYVASIVSDMAKEGQTAVDWLASQGLDSYNIIHIQGVMGSAAQIGRTGALDAQVAANDNWNMVTQQTAEWNAETAQQIVQSVIDSGKEFNVIYAENDDMAKGAVAALDKANISHGVARTSSSWASTATSGRLKSCSLATGTTTASATPSRLPTSTPSSRIWKTARLRLKRPSSWTRRASTLPPSRRKTLTTTAFDQTLNFA